MCASQAADGFALHRVPAFHSLALHQPGCPASPDGPVTCPERPAPHGHEHAIPWTARSTAALPIHGSPGTSFACTRGAPLSAIILHFAEYHWRSPSLMQVI